MFSVVIFDKTDTTGEEVEVAPTSWMGVNAQGDSYCKWPPFQPTRQDVIDQLEPDSTWRRFEARAVFNDGTVLL